MYINVTIFPYLQLGMNIQCTVLRGASSLQINVVVLLVVVTTAEDINTHNILAAENKLETCQCNRGSKLCPVNANRYDNIQT